MKLSFRKKLMLLSIVPAVIVAVVIAIMSINTSMTNISMEAEENLHSVALSLEEMANFEDLASNQHILDKFKKDLDIDTTLFVGDVREVTTVNGAVGTKADPSIYAKVKAGENYFSSKANVNGEQYFAYYIPVYGADGNFIGMSFAGKPTKTMNAMVIDLAVNTLIMASAILAVVVVLIIIVSRIMIKQLLNSGKIIDELSKGNLNVDMDAKSSNDEIGDIYRKAVLLVEKLRDSVGSIVNVSEELLTMSGNLSETSEAASSGTDGMASAIEDIANGAGSQAEETQDGALNIDEVNNHLIEIKEQTGELENISRMMQDIEEVVMQEIKSSMDINEKTNSELGVVNEKVEKTSVSIENIKKGTDIIKSIAEQIQLLALNASIEAARAGEHGKGFAVVATNVGTLASESKEASQTIDDILTELLFNYEEMKNSVAGLVEQIGQQSTTIVSTSKQFTVLDENIVRVVEFINKISKATEEVKKLSELVVGTMSNLSSISEENAASTEETMASIEELNATISEVSDNAKKLNDISGKLIETVEFFKL